MELRDRPFMESLYRELALDFADGFPQGLENAFVVVDDTDKPLMMAGVKMVPELVMICDQRPSVPVRLRAIAMMHEELREKYPHGAFAFVSPNCGKNFIATMRKRFGWKKTWEGYQVT
jgi:hypothetical protein